MMERLGEERGRFFAMRQVLNTLFILTALAGMFIYFKGNRDVGSYLLIACCVLKFAEVTLRLMKL